MDIDTKNDDDGALNSSFKNNLLIDGMSQNKSESNLLQEFEVINNI